MNLNKTFLLLVLPAFVLSSCHSFQQKDDQPKLTKMQRKVAEYKPFKLTTDLSLLSEKDKKIIPLLIEASDIIDELFWMQSFGNKNQLLQSIKNEDTLKYVMINYGPWDRLDGNKPFIPGYGAKPLGANFYPADMSYEEFQKCSSKDKFGLYNLIVYDVNHNLNCVPYHIAYQDNMERISVLLRQAADITDNESFKNFLNLRAVSLITDEFADSDQAWMDSKDNNLDIIIGPIQDLEDHLFRAKAAYESLVVVKDQEWSKKLEKFSLLVPFLQQELPFDDKYKKETPSETSQIGVYDLIYNTGYSNAGNKLIAINLPIDNQIRTVKGNRKLQFKNTLKAKFDNILVPISDLVIAEEQRKNITFDAFFQNSLFWEIGNAMGVTKTVNSGQSVKDALKEYHYILNDCKSDLLSLYFITKLYNMGQIDVNLMDHYVTFMASIFRSVRFGATDAQGKANMISFYYLEENGAFTRNDKTGTYTVNFEIMQKACMDLAGKIIKIQGDGDFVAARALAQEKGFIREDLYNDLVRIAKSHIPKDIVFEQGLEVLQLSK